MGCMGQDEISRSIGRCQKGHDSAYMLCTMFSSCTLLKGPAPCGSTPSAAFRLAITVSSIAFLALSSSNACVIFWKAVIASTLPLRILVAKLREVLRKFEGCPAQSRQQGRWCDRPGTYDDLFRWVQASHRPYSSDLPGISGLAQERCSHR